MDSIEYRNQRLKEDPELRAASRRELQVHLWIVTNPGLRASLLRRLAELDALDDSQG